MSTHDEIARSLTALYRLFVKLGYLTVDEINWPPHNAKPFNVSKCLELGYHTLAVYLLRKIPWTTTTIPIYKESVTVDYSCDDELESVRDPAKYMIDDPEDPQPIDGWMIALVYGEMHGLSLQLDAKEGTIRLLDTVYPTIAKDKRFHPDYLGHYLNREPQPAAPFIEKLIEEYSTLERIPANGQILGQSHPLYERTKAAMLAYGWPDSFRTDDFRHDIGILQQQWLKDEADRIEQEG